MFEKLGLAIRRVFFQIRKRIVRIRLKKQIRILAFADFKIADINIFKADLSPFGFQLPALGGT